MPYVYFTPEELPYKAKGNGNWCDISGQQFGRLTTINVIGRYVTPSNPRRHELIWCCKCECGKIVSIKASALKTGHATSCGCSHLRHGMTKSKTYKAWRNIRSRCYKPAANGFHNYGGRGIQVCQGWQAAFENFFADMGEPPSVKHSIDRIDNNGNYSCGHCEECIDKRWNANCRWATPDEQRDQTRRTVHVTIDNIRRSLAQWAKEPGAVHRALINRRLRAGWEPSRAVFHPRQLRTP